MNRKWLISFVLMTLSSICVAYCSEPVCHDASSNDQTALRLQRPKDGFVSGAKGIADPAIGFDRQRFDGAIEDHSFRSDRKPLAGFAEHWYAQLKKPVCCPMILCHGACANMDSACRLPSAETGVFETLAGSGCDMQCSAQN